MGSKRFVLSLNTTGSDYQVEEAAEAERAAHELGAELKVLYAEGDAVRQSEELLNEIYSRSGRPYAIVVQPVGTPLKQVANAAITAGIGWVVLNRDADYLEELRSRSKVPVLEVTTDHTEIGRIQGLQMVALLPNGGHVLYLEGPILSQEAQQRKEGTLETKSQDITLHSMRSQWGRQHAAAVVEGFLRLSTSHESKIALIAAHSDSIAMGARDAFEGISDPVERHHWLSLPFLGCHGCKNSGQVWTENGLLTATVHMPLLTGLAFRLVDKAMSGSNVDAVTVVVPQSFPPVERLKPRNSVTVGMTR